MERITSFGNVDALAVSGEIKMPLVIIKTFSGKKISYNGFIPGVTKKDICCDSLELCKQELKDSAKKIIEVMGKENIAFPFFPTKEELLQDYKNIEYISFITIKSQKRKSSN